jgi:hypothetical protein
MATIVIPILGVVERLNIRLNLRPVSLATKETQKLAGVERYRHPLSQNPVALATIAIQKLGGVEK